eukprot:gene636-353_t
MFAWLQALENPKAKRAAQRMAHRKGKGRRLLAEGIETSLVLFVCLFVCLFEYPRKPHGHRRIEPLPLRERQPLAPSSSNGLMAQGFFMLHDTT